jgi:cytochrome c551/c552
VVPAPGPATEAAGGDRVLALVWRCHRQWSLAADAAQSQLRQWRQRNLALLVLGALAGALAAQHGLSSGFVTAAAIVSAISLAAAAWLQRTALTSDETAHWTGARAASEALKAEVYRYLIRVKPYDGAERTERLDAQLEVIQTRGQPWLVDQQLISPDNTPLPAVTTFAGYLAERAQRQANWHRDKIAEHIRKARTLRICQLAATGAGVVLAAVAGALPGSHLAAWTAAATTIAAAFATHLAAEQHQRIAASYASTADQLDRLIADVDPAITDPDRQAQFVLGVEQVLAAQNSGWMDLLSPHTEKTADQAAPLAATG